jgi:hypothetical protein
MRSLLKYYKILKGKANLDLEMKLTADKRGSALGRQRRGEAVASHRASRVPRLEATVVAFPDL